MPPKTTRKPRRGLFDQSETLSFAIEQTEADAVRDAAMQRGIPFSQWLREALREKLAIGSRSKKAA